MNKSFESRKEIIYQIFPRQYAKDGKLKEITRDLDRIKDLGVTIIYLMPINPIGITDRKGTVGSPYSIKDYTKIDPNLGSLDDLKNLINEAHKKNLKVMLDMVFNHTSKDSVLTEKHPEWFYHKENGDFANRVGDWSDITDLNYNYKETTTYLTDVLLSYIDYGIDGFRFDVAPLIPEFFWDYAVPKMRNKNPNIILLSESVHLSFTKYLRDQGYETLSDCEMYKWFDMLYEYDVHPYLLDYCENKVGIDKFLNAVLDEESQFPTYYNKIRYLENHDFGRINGIIHDDIRVLNLLVLNYFLKGSPFLYAGIETITEHQPDLFENDKIDWSNYNKLGIVDLIKKLNKLKKDDTMASGIWNYDLLNKDVVKISLEDKNKTIIALINLNHSKKEINPGFTNGFNYIENEYKTLNSSYVPNELPEIFIINKK